MDTRSEDGQALDGDRLQDLLDRDAIRHIQIRYAWSLDNLRWEALHEIFTPDAVADFRGEVFEGVEAIAAKCALVAGAAGRCPAHERHPLGAGGR